jgi:hypothetical protein
MNDYFLNNLSTIIALFGSAGFGGLLMYFFLFKVKFKKEKSENERETVLANDVSLDTYINRINKMSENFDLSMEMMSKSQKAELESKTKILELQYELEAFRQKVKNNCNNNCTL